MITEIAVERYRLDCGECETSWYRDYDVQYLADSEGDVWAFYRLDGAPAMPPTAGEELCPRCHRLLHVHLVARRDAPLAHLDSDHPRQPVTGTAADRQAVPALPAQVPHPAGHADPPRPGLCAQPESIQPEPMGSGPGGTSAA